MMQKTIMLLLPSSILVHTINMEKHYQQFMPMKEMAGYAYMVECHILNISALYEAIMCVFWVYCHELSGGRTYFYCVSSCSRTRPCHQGVAITEV